MAFINFGGIGGMAMGWATSMLFWGAIVLLMFGVFIVALIVRQKRRFIFPCLEIVSLGQGKVSIQVTKAGWFKKRRFFFGLLESGGEQELICKDLKRKIHSISSTDYHEINGKRGVICKRKDDDPDVLVPIDNVQFADLHLLMRVAPADYRDAAVDILESKRKETMSWLEKNSPLLVSIGIFIFGLIALIIIFNFAKGESSAWREFATMARSGAQVVASTTAP